MAAYKQLEALFTRLHRLKHFLALASWDAQTKMPPKGVTARGNAIGELEKVIHSILTDPSTKDLLEQATAAKDTHSMVEQANLREMQRLYNEAACVPADFVARKATLTTEAKSVWVKARAANDFSIFSPYLKQLVELAREEAGYRSAATGLGLYESLFQQFEPGMPIDSVHRIFTDVKGWLPGLLKEILVNRKDVVASTIAVEGPISAEKQEALVRHFMKVWEFDSDAGRLDITAHPFCGMVIEDTRITTKYHEDQFSKAMFSTIHETGHARYQQNMGPREKLGQPVCDYRSLAIHESQSLLAERIIGKSAAFAEYMTPFLKEYLGDQPAFTAENMRKLNQIVQPTYIRVAADEVTYPMHVILRYEIERALIEGTLEAEDVPRVWNEKMEAYLGLSTLGDDANGCLQDIHWSLGAIGYFSTYSLGAMFATQLLATIKAELGEDVVDKCIRTGEMQPIFAKQKEKIWDHGCVYLTEELMIKATGEPLNPKYFREHLERRYLRNED